MAHYLIRLAQEDGVLIRELQDVSEAIDNFIVPASERLKGLARHIDPYGSTSFNGIQCEELFDEFNKFESSALSPLDLAFFEDLKRMLSDATNEVHLHVHFVGD